MFFYSFYLFYLLRNFKRFLRSYCKDVGIHIDNKQLRWRILLMSLYVDIAYLVLISAACPLNRIPYDTAAVGLVHHCLMPIGTAKLWSLAHFDTWYILLSEDEIDKESTAYIKYREYVNLNLLSFMLWRQQSAEFTNVLIHPSDCLYGFFWQLYYFFNFNCVVGHALLLGF